MILFRTLIAAALVVSVAAKPAAYDPLAVGKKRRLRRFSLPSERHPPSRWSSIRRLTWTSASGRKSAGKSLP